ncbi:MAG: SDR family oxidoreductase [Wenzhouxiangellaceae bacterium]
MATIVITGANRGIGLAMARAYAQRGDRVIGICRRPSEALSALGQRIESGIDVTDGDALRSLTERLSDVSIDVLINNAGVLHRDDFEHLESHLEHIRQQFEINTLAPIRVTRALRDRLGAGAKVAIITSRMGSLTDNDSGGYWGYRISKAAVNMAGVNLAHELRPGGISVALLHPGYVRTDMTGHTGHVDPEESAAALIERIDQLTLDASGGFWHANGERLPW